MKNIVFVIESLHLGGAEKTLVTLLQNLDYSKYKVDLITFQEGGFFIDDVPQEVNHVVLEFPKLNFIERIKYFMRRKLNNGTYHSSQLLWSAMSNKLHPKEKSYDIAIAYNQGFATYFTSEYIKASVKYAWLNINYEIAKYNIDFDYLFYRKYTKIICVSNQVEQILNACCERKGYILNTLTIKDIVEKEDILQRAKEGFDIQFSTEHLNIVSVGRLAKQKAFDTAVSACKILIDKGFNINWYVIGEGGERSYLEELLKNKNLENKFFLVGAKKNPYPYVSKSDIFVQTSIYEGLGTTLIEASFLNKPIVTTNFPSAYSIITHEETGLISEMNANAISEQIERLIVDQELKQKLVSNLESQENNDKKTTMNQINQLFDS